MSDLKATFFLVIMITGMLYTPIATRGQSPVFQYSDSSLSSYLTAHANLEELFLCTRSLVLVRFRIDPSGKVRNLSFSKGTDTLLKGALQRALESTNGKWNPEMAGKKPVMSEYLLLPCFVSIENGCNQNVIDNYFKLRDSMSRSRFSQNLKLDSLLRTANSRTVLGRSLDAYFSIREFESLEGLFAFDDEKLSSPRRYLTLEQVSFVVRH